MITKATVQNKKKQNLSSKSNLERLTIYNKLIKPINYVLIKNILTLSEKQDFDKIKLFKLIFHCIFHCILTSFPCIES